MYDTTLCFFSGPLSETFWIRLPKFHNPCNCKKTEVGAREKKKKREREKEMKRQREKCSEIPRERKESSDCLLTV